MVFVREECAVDLSPEARKCALEQTKDLGRFVEGLDISFCYTERGEVSQEGDEFKVFHVGNDGAYDFSTEVFFNGAGEYLRHSQFGASTMGGGPKEITPAHATKIADATISQIQALAESGKGKVASPLQRRGSQRPF